MSTDARPAVLVVDDVQANLTAVEALLSDLECELVCVNSGQQALRQLLKRKFAVILLDVQMPEMDGYEVAEYAHKSPASRDTPIVFLTATTDTREGVLRGYGSGAVDYLFKPLDSAVLRSKVKVFLALHASRQEIATAKEALEEKNRELERAYKELQATQAQLVQSAKMASLGTLVAGVAHEVNNPLGFVLSHMSTIRRGLAELASSAAPDTQPKWDKLQNRLMEAATGLERIRDLVLKLRTFSRLDQGERKVVSLRESIDSVLVMLQHRTRDRIQIHTQISGPDQLDCSPGPFNQALLNLVSNAIDAIEDTGEVTLTARVDDGGLSLDVRDTGSGIAPDHLEHIFEPFFTTKPPGEGTGLGLSITYSIVKAHGGTLEVAHTGDRGTCMRLTMPHANSVGH